MAGYSVEIIWTQPHGGTSRWEYSGTPADLARELRNLAADVDTLAHAEANSKAVDGG